MRAETNGPERIKHSPRKRRFGQGQKKTGQKKTGKELWEGEGVNTTHEKRYRSTKPDHQ